MSEWRILTKRRRSLLSSFSKVNPLTKLGTAAACGCAWADCLSLEVLVDSANWLCSLSNRFSSFSDSCMVLLICSNWFCTSKERRYKQRSSARVFYRSHHSRQSACPISIPSSWNCRNTRVLRDSWIRTKLRRRRWLSAFSLPVLSAVLATVRKKFNRHVQIRHWDHLLN